MHPREHNLKRCAGDTRERSLFLSSLAKPAAEITVRGVLYVSRCSESDNCQESHSVASLITHEANRSYLYSVRVVKRSAG